MMRSGGLLRFLAISILLLCSATNAASWSIFSRRTSKEAGTPPLRLDGAGFSIDGARNDPRGARLVDNAQRRIEGPAACWGQAYTRLFASCADIMADKERQSRLAWHLSSCFQEDSGRPPLPDCDDRSAMLHCRRRLSESEDMVFLEFFLETNTLCHQLQAEAFKHSTERLVNDLSRTSKSAYEKLETIEERSDHLLHESENIRDSLSSIAAQTDRLTAASTAVGAQIDKVRPLEGHLRAVQGDRGRAGGAQGRAGRDEGRGGRRRGAGGGVLQDPRRRDGQAQGRRRGRREGDQGRRRRHVVEDGRPAAHRRRHRERGRQVAGEPDAAAGWAGEGDARAQRTPRLPGTSSRREQGDDSEARALRPAAAGGAAGPARGDHLIQNSHSILEAQEEFRAKQANIFAALDKLYVLHNAILVESRFIKAFFFYCCITFLIYMLTSAKQTFDIRGHLYFGLRVTIMLEVGVIKLGADDFNTQFWVLSKVLLVRSVFIAAAVVQILHSIFTYKDYDVLNHHLLQTLVEKVRAIEGKARGGGMAYNPYSSENDGSLSSYSWIFDELEDEVDSRIDPDFVPPKNGVLLEQIGENSITTSDSRRYNLRPRNRPC